MSFQIYMTFFLSGEHKWTKPLKISKDPQKTEIHTGLTEHDIEYDHFHFVYWSFFSFYKITDVSPDHLKQISDDLLLITMLM